jgi:hypothetical protein
VGFLRVQQAGKEGGRGRGKDEGRWMGEEGGGVEEEGRGVGEEDGKGLGCVRESCGGCACVGERWRLGSDVEVDRSREA